MSAGGTWFEIARTLSQRPESHKRPGLRFGVPAGNRDYFAESNGFSPFVKFGSMAARSTR